MFYSERFKKTTIYNRMVQEKVSCQAKSKAQKMNFTLFIAGVCGK